MTALSSKFPRIMPRIMVAIDGSEHSLKAAEYALEVAKSYRARLLYAVTVTYSPESYLVKQPDISAESKGKADYTGNDIVSTLLEKFNNEAKENDIQLKTELINGYRSWPLIDGAGRISTGTVPAEYLLVEYAEKENIDLIVVGTRGTSRFKRLLIGSVSSGVVKHAHCTVLVVR